MPKVIANKITVNYEQQGTGEPLILIPYLAADHACYALYERVEEFNQRTLVFLRRYAGAAVG